MSRINNSANTLARYLSIVIATVLVLLPFHAFFTTWLGSNFGHLDLFRIWKELILVAILPFALWLCLTSHKLRQWLKTDWLVRLSVIYILLFILTGIWALHKHEVNGSALIYGWLSDLRLFGFMLIAFCVSALDNFLSRQWLKLLLGPAMIVIVFGLLQRFVLSYDFLKHFGYGPDTIQPYQTIDQKIEYRRIQSTLRGANPLGAYLVFILTAAAGELWRRRLRLIVSGILLGGVVVLGFTYSRSAWVALLPSTGLILWWYYDSPQLRRTIAIGLTLIFIAGAGVLTLARNDPTLQNTFFHTDSYSASSESSNASRISSMETSAKTVLHEPFGRGPGTAGPASTRNNHPARIAENYYLQIAQEAGWLALGLFLAINIIVVLRLWHQRSSLMAQVLFASWIGLALINLVSHAWADDTLGLLWWGLAGVALGAALPQPVILNKKRKHYATKKAATQ